MKQTKNIVILVLFISFCMFAITSMAATSENTQKMTEEELATITEMLNKVENNGFLQSTYSKPSEINLNMAFRQCGTEIGYGSEAIEEEKQDLLDLSHIGELNIPIYKLTEKQVIDLYELKTGETITKSDIKQRFRLDI